MPMNLKGNMNLIHQFKTETEEGDSNIVIVIRIATHWSQNLKPPQNRSNSKLRIILFRDVHQQFAFCDQPVRLEAYLRQSLGERERSGLINDIDIP